MRRLFTERPLLAWGLSVLLLLLVVSGYYAFHALFVKVGRSVEQPFSGPARSDPYYVLQRYLEARGTRVRHVRNWPQPLARDTAVLWFTNAPLPSDLRAWLAEGGQLWTFDDPDAPEDAEPWEPTPWPGEEPVGEAPASSVETVEEEQTASAEEEQTRAAAQDTEDGDPAPEDDAPTEEAQAAEEEEEAVAEEDEEWCEDGCLSAAQFRYGAGCLTLVHGYALHNEQVILGETPARVDALLTCPQRPAVVLLVSGAGSPWFGQLLLEHAPQALLAFFALLALSLWRAAKHLGPKLPPRKRERRQMLEHVGAVGTLAGRVGLATMLAAARRELCLRVARRAPHAASLSGEPLVVAVARATELDPGEVRRALLDEPGADRHAALAVARAVQALWRKT